eukprot:gene309-1119_t
MIRIRQSLGPGAFRFCRASSSTAVAPPEGVPGGEEISLSVQEKVRKHFRLKEVFNRVEVRREDERKVKAALHAVSSYTDDTKLSLRAWHFQELSNCPPLCDWHLAMDSRYVELRNTLFREMYALSNAQLVSFCMSAMRLKISWPGFWKKVSKAILRRISWNKNMTFSLSRFDTATILFAMAKGRALLRKDSTVVRNVLKFMLQESQEWSFKEMVFLTQFFNKYNMKPEDPAHVIDRKIAKVLTQVVWALNNKLHYSEAGDLVDIFWNFSCLDLMPSRCIYAGIRHIVKNAKDLDDGVLLQFCVILSRWQAQLNDKESLRRVARILLERPLTPDNVATLLTCFQKHNFRHVELLNELGNFVAQTPPSHLSEKSTGCIAHSLGQLGISRPAMWKPLFEKAAEQSSKWAPLTLSNFVYSAGRANAVFSLQQDGQQELAKETMSALSNAITETVTGFTSVMMVKALSGYILLGEVFEPAMFRAILAQYITTEDGLKIYKKRTRHMSRVMFSVLLEQPQILEQLPRYLHVALEKYVDPWEFRVERLYHPRVARLVEGLPNVSSKILAKKGPYHVDLKFLIESGPHKGMKIGIDFLSEESLCPLTGQLLGEVGTKSRHFELFGWNYEVVRRDHFFKLNAKDQRSAICDILRSYEISIDEEMLPLLDDLAHEDEQPRRQTICSMTGKVSFRSKKEIRVDWNKRISTETTLAAQ